MTEKLRPCPLCGSTNITCFAEYDGYSYENEPIYRAVVGCLGCHEDGCDPSYDEEPCFGIEAYFPNSHPLLKDCEDPSDCERALERHMAERWNRRAERTCRLIHEVEEENNEFFDTVELHYYMCSECGWNNRPDACYCDSCGARVIEEGV